MHVRNEHTSPCKVIWQWLVGSVSKERYGCQLQNVEKHTYSHTVPLLQASRVKITQCLEKLLGCKLSEFGRFSSSNAVEVNQGPRHFSFEWSHYDLRTISNSRLWLFILPADARRVMQRHWFGVLSWQLIKRLVRHKRNEKDSFGFFLMRSSLHMFITRRISVSYSWHVIM